MAAAFDLEQVLLSPYGPTEAFYSSSRYKNHNFIVTELNTMKTYCYLWNECEGAKGSCELCPKSTLKKHNFQKWEFQCRKGPISIYMSHFQGVLTIRTKLIPLNRFQSSLSDIHVFGHRTVLN